MDYVPIFGKAWELSTLGKYKKLLWFAFFPALMTTVITTLVYSLRGYQYWEEFFGTKSMLEIMMDISGAIVSVLSSNVGLGIIAVIFVILFTLAYWLFPAYFHGGLIKMIPEAAGGKEVRFRTGVIYASEYFLPLFEYKVLFSPFRLSWVFVTYWLIRTFMPEILGVMLIPIGIWFVVNLIVTVFFIFTEFFIVLDDDRVIPAIGKSIKLVFMNLEQVVYILFLVLLIGLRVIFNTAITFGVPALVIFLGSLVASSVLSIIVFIVAILLGLALLLLVTYINAIIDVFFTAVWAMLFARYKRETEVA